MDVEDGKPRAPRGGRVRPLCAPGRLPFLLEAYTVDFQGGQYCTTFPVRHRFFLVLVLRSSECILEESGSPGIHILVFSLVLGIGEISTSGSPTVVPGERR